MHIYIYSDDLGEQLCEASHDGRVGEVERLLAIGIPVNRRDSDGWAALHRACSNNRADVVKILTQQDGIDVNVQTTYKDTPLHWACCNGHVECVQLLMATGKCDLGKFSVCMCCMCDTPMSQVCKQFIAKLYIRAWDLLLILSGNYRLVFLAFYIKSLRYTISGAIIIITVHACIIIRNRL